MALPVLTVTALTSDGTEPIMVAAGGNFTIALRFDGTVWAWGNNANGRLGNGTVIASNTPVQVRGVGGTGYLTNIVAVSAGQDHALALRDDGRVFAWGSGANGRLGNGLLLDSNTPVYVSIPGGTVIEEISAGTAHSVARTDDGHLFAWGLNTNARLGDGTATQRPAPVFVLESAGVPFTNVAEIAAGGIHTVARRSNGTVWAWGGSADGQVGNGSNTASIGFPAQVLGEGGTGTLENIVEISAGTAHTVARASNGTVWAWGNNTSGRLGDGTTTQRTAPVQVQGITNATQIAAGGEHTIALRSDNTVWAWGANNMGQLGDGNGAVGVVSATPVQVEAFGTVSSISAGLSHNAAVRSDAAVWAWGANANGQLGDNTTTARTSPVQVHGPSSAGSLNLRVIPLTDTAAVNLDRDALSLSVILGDNTANTNIITNLNLPTSGANYSNISWVSSVPGIISNTGVVTRPAMAAGNATVTLTATVQRGAVSLNATFTLTVIADVSHTEAVAEDIAWLTWDRFRGENVLEANIMHNLNMVLLDPPNSSMFTWISSHPSVISSAGVVTRPPLGYDPIEVTLTARAYRGGHFVADVYVPGYLSDPREFIVIVPPQTADIIVESITSPYVFINLTAETIHGIPFDVAEFSTNGGGSWRRGALPTGTAFSNMFNREMTLSVRSERGGGQQIDFPRINRRPRANPERLRPWFGEQTWTLRARASGSNSPADPPALPTMIYDFIKADTTTGRMPANADWTAVHPGYSIDIVVAERGVRVAYFFRSAAQIINDEFVPASRPFRIRPAAFRNPTRLTINYVSETIRTRPGQEFSTTYGIWLPVPTDADGRIIPFDVSQYITDGTPIQIRTAATGRRTPTIAQTITPLPRAQLFDSGAQLRDLSIVGGRIDAQQLRAYQVLLPNTNNWRGLPRINANNAGAFTIRVSPTVRRDRDAVGGFSGYAASMPGTISVHWDVVSFNNRGNPIMGVARAVITPYGHALFDISLD